MNLLVLGSDSLTGRALLQLASTEGLTHHALGTEEFLGLKKGELTKTLTRLNPSIVIYAATFSGFEHAEVDNDAARLCDRVNSLGVSAIAELCVKLQVPLIFHSSSFVFDGNKTHPYLETDVANPLNRYGISKLAGERVIRELLPAHIILRTDWVFSRERPRYFEQLLTDCKQGKGKLSVIAHRFSPTPAPDVARVILAIAKQADCAMDVWGTYHYCALQPMSQEYFAEQVIHEAAKYDPEIAQLLPRLDISKLPVTRPWIGNSVLGTQHLFETFGIKQRARLAELNVLLQKVCNFTPAETVPAPALPEAEPKPDNRNETAEKKTAKNNPAKGSGARRLRKKSGSARPAKKADTQTR